MGKSAPVLRRVPNYLNPLAPIYGEPLTTIVLKLDSSSPEAQAELRPIQSMDGRVTLYKYLARHHAEDLVRGGSTRVGTLHDFRRVELGRGISDPDEGRLRVKRSLAGPHTFAPETDSAKSMGFFGLDIHEPTQIADINFKREIDHPDVYVWCCSTKSSSEVMASLEGAETCVEIRNPGLFFERMSEALNAIRPVEFLGFRAITYT